MSTHYKSAHFDYTLCGLSTKDKKVVVVGDGATCKNCIKGKIKSSPEEIIAFDIVSVKKRKPYTKTGTKRQGRGSYYAK